MSNGFYKFEITRVERKLATFGVDSELSLEEAENKACELAADYDYSRQSYSDNEYVVNLISAPVGSKIITREEKYLETAGNCCPNCGGDDFECGDMESDGLEAWRPITCNDCDASWEDSYRMTGIGKTSGFDPSERLVPE